MSIKLDPEQFRQDVSINPNDLQGGFVEHPGLFAHYAALHVEALRAEARAKMMAEISEAKAGKEARDAYVRDGVKVTEGLIEQAVKLSPDVIKARYAYNEAKAMTQLAYHAVEAFRQRRDMLIQMGASEREERKSNPAIRLNSGEGAKDALRQFGHNN